MHKTSEWLQTFSTDQFAHTEKSFLKDPFHHCQKISITGGKGGVGKTSIALKTAQELSQAGYKTLLIDCDSNLSNTAIKLGLPIDNLKFEKLLSAEASFEEVILQHGNFHLLPACNGSMEIFETKLQFEQIIKDIIEAHESEYDFILLDCPAGISKEMLELNAICDHRWIVVVPDKSSITDSYSLMKILANKYGVQKNHLIVNMYQTEKQLERVVTTLTETVKKFLQVDVEVLGGVKKAEISADGFDTFFLSETKNETHKKFVKLLYTFTEKVGGPNALDSARAGQMALEQDVH